MEPNLNDTKCINIVHFVITCGSTKRRKYEFYSAMKVVEKKKQRNKNGGRGNRNVGRCIFLVEGGEYF